MLLNFNEPNAYLIVTLIKKVRKNFFNHRIIYEESRWLKLLSCYIQIRKCQLIERIYDLTRYWNLFILSFIIG